MVKGCAVAAVLVLLLSSASLAAIGQNQGFLLDNTNNVLAQGPQGGSSNTNTLLVAQDQLASDAGGHVIASQGEVGSLVQSAGAAAMAGTLGVIQAGLGYGVQGQTQNGSPTDLGTQLQDLNANLSQHIIGDGLGSALGLQNFVGFQMQMTFTIFGASANSQAIGVSLVDALGRPTPGPGAMLSAGSNIGLTQLGAP